MKVKARTISISITLLTYVVLTLFIVVSIVFYTKPRQPGPFVLPTISELIDDRPENGFIYLIFVVVYGTVKVVLIALSLLDSKVLHSELIEKKQGINAGTPTSREFFMVMSAVTGVLAAFQLMCMVILVFFPISKNYRAHFTVAALSFGSALLKSFFLLMRRKLLYALTSVFYLSNVAYYLAFVGTLIAFYYTRYGYAEYILVFLILLENVFLAIEFYNLTFTVKVSVVADETGITEDLDLEPMESSFEHPFKRTRLIEEWMKGGI